MPPSIAFNNSSTSNQDRVRVASEGCSPVTMYMLTQSGLHFSHPANALWCRQKKEEQKAEQKRVRKEKADKEAADKAAAGVFRVLCLVASQLDFTVWSMSVTSNFVHTHLVRSCITAVWCGISGHQDQASLESELIFHIKFMCLQLMFATLSCCRG